MDYRVDELEFRRMLVLPLSVIQAINYSPSRRLGIDTYQICQSREISPHFSDGALDTLILPVPSESPRSGIYISGSNALDLPGNNVHRVNMFHNTFLNETDSQNTCWPEQP